MEAFVTDASLGRAANDGGEKYGRHSDTKA